MILLSRSFLSTPNSKTAYIFYNGRAVVTVNWSYSPLSAYGTIIIFKKSQVGSAKAVALIRMLHGQMVSQSCRSNFVFVKQKIGFFTRFQFSTWS
jgi:hypothetical protein